MPDTDKPLAEAAATWQRELGTDPRDPEVDKGLNVAEDDLLVDRPDLPTDSHVFVAKGDRIPAEVAAAVATPVDPGPAAKAKKVSARKVAAAGDART